MDPVDIYYDIAKAQASEQDERRQHFDTIAVGMLGFSGVLIGLSSFATSNWAGWSVGPFAVSLIGFMGVAYFCLHELWLRGWNRQPLLADLYRHLNDPQYKDADIMTWCGSQISRAIDQNETHLRSKARALSWSYRVLSLQVIAVGILVVSIGQNVISSS